MDYNGILKKIGGDTCVLLDSEELANHFHKYRYYPHNDSHKTIVVDGMYTCAVVSEGDVISDVITDIRDKERRIKEILNIKCNSIVAIPYDQCSNINTDGVIVYPVERRGKEQDRWDREVISEDEIEMMLDVCKNEQQYTLILGLYGTGMRISEFLAMKRKWISEDGNILVINVPFKDGSFKCKTKAGERKIYVTDGQAAHAIKDWFKHNKEIGITRNKAWQWVTAIGRKAGLEKRITPHVFRHSLASKLINNDGIDPAIVGKMLGHKKSSVTMDVYVHDTEETPDWVKNNEKND